jgi:hypothetical protein
LNLIFFSDINNLHVQIIGEHLSIGSGAEQKALFGIGTDTIVYENIRN